MLRQRCRPRAADATSTSADRERERSDAYKIAAARAAAAGQVGTGTPAATRVGAARPLHSAQGSATLEPHPSQPACATAGRRALGRHCLYTASACAAASAAAAEVPAAAPPRRPPPQRWPPPPSWPPPRHRLRLEGVVRAQRRCLGQRGRVHAPAAVCAGGRVQLSWGGTAVVQARTGGRPTPPAGWARGLSRGMEDGGGPSSIRPPSAATVDAPRSRGSIR